MKCSNDNCTVVCLESSALTCTKCKEHHYCSEKCKVADWDEGHNTICDKVRKEKLKRTEIKCPFIKLGKYLNDQEADKLVPKGSEIYTRYEPVTEPRRLGRGSYGEVILMKDKVNNELVAMKIISKERIIDKRAMDRLKNEINIQKHLIHENIVRILSHVETNKNIYIIMEYANKGNLFQFIRTKGKLTEKEAFFFFTQTCSAVHFLHSHGIMHRDIKPENLLVSNNGILKLCDFGSCARNNDASRVKFCGTIDYMAPEVVSNKESDEKADVWSLGILLYEMLHGYAPFLGRDKNDIMARIQNNKILFRNIYEDTKLLIETITNSEPTQRPEVWEIFLHPWVQRMQKEFGITEYSTKENINNTSKVLGRVITKMPKLIHTAYSARNTNKRAATKSSSYSKGLEDKLNSSEMPSDYRVDYENDVKASEFYKAKKRSQSHHKVESLDKPAMECNSLGFIPVTNTNEPNKDKPESGCKKSYINTDSDIENNVVKIFPLEEFINEEGKDGCISKMKDSIYTPTIKSKKKSLFIVANKPKCLANAKITIINLSRRKHKIEHNKT